MEKGLSIAKNGLHSAAKLGVLFSGFVVGLVLLGVIAVGIKFELLYNKVDSRVFQVINETTTGTGFQLHNPKTNKTFFVTNHHICAKANGDTLVVDVNGKLTEIHILLRNEPNDMCISEPLPGIKGLEPTTSVKGAIFMIDGFGYGIKDIKFGKFVQKFTRRFPIAPITKVSEYWPKFKVQTMTEAQCKGDGYSIGPVRLKTGGEIMACFGTQTSLIGTMKAYPGNSGSPIVNLDGDVVSLVWGTEEPLFVSLSIPIQKFLDLSAKL